MSKHITTSFLLAALSLVPLAGVAQTHATIQKPVATKPSSAPATPTHATRGVVKSIDATTLVISRTGTSHADMAFALNAATHREGTIAPGASVSVRYREDGKTHVATAVRAQAGSRRTAHPTTPSHS